MSYYCLRSKPRPPENPSPFRYDIDIFFNGVYRLRDLEMVLQMMAERCRRIDFSSADRCSLSPTCFI